MSVLDALICSSSEGLSLAPDDAGAQTPALKAPIGKSPAGGSNLAIAGKWVLLFCAPEDVPSTEDALFIFAMEETRLFSPCLLAGWVTDEQKEVMVTDIKTAEEWLTILLVEAQGSGHHMDPAGVVKSLEFYDQAMTTRGCHIRRGVMMHRLLSSRGFPRWNNRILSALTNPNSCGRSEENSRPLL
eukprot:scaffold83212_cov59-Attheya_sp.AAC.7